MLKKNHTTSVHFCLLNNFLITLSMDLTCKRVSFFPCCQFSYILKWIIFMVRGVISLDIIGQYNIFKGYLFIYFNIFKNLW